MSALIHDMKYAFRQLLKYPGTSLIAAMALAFGIAVVTLLFSMANCLLLRPLPFENSDRLFLLERVDPKSHERCPFWMAEWATVKEETESFEAMAGFSWFGNTELKGEGLSDVRYSSSMASANLLDVLREKPLKGRWFTPGEERPGSPRFVVLSYRAWQRDFQGDEQVLGCTVHMDGQPATVIGVMPDGFHFPFNQDVWTNLKWDKLLALEVIPMGRLKPEVSLASARAELEVLGLRWAEQIVPHFAQSIEELTSRRSNWDPNETEHLLAEARRCEDYTLVRPRGFFDYVYYHETMWPIWVMVALGVCILLIACVNVAGLLCARASTRLRELAMRSALGASRRRLIAQMLYESLIIAVIGTVGGLMLSSWGGRVLSFYLSQQPDQPFWFRLVHDWRVFVFAACALVFAGVASGLIPSLQSTRLDVNKILKEADGRGSGLHLGRFHRWLVVGEVALSLPLMQVAGATVKAVASAYASFPAGHPNHVLTGRIESMAGADGRTDGRLALIPHLEALPGVESATLSERLPGFTQGRIESIELDGPSNQSQAQSHRVFVEVISPHYFRTLERNLLQGRDFAETDGKEAMPVAIVNEAFARRRWPARSALGQRFRCPNRGSDWLTVVGVAPNLRMQGGYNRPSDGCGVYLPHAQHSAMGMTVFIRVPGDPLRLTGALRETVHTLDSNGSVHSIATLSTAMASAAGNFRIFAGLFVVLALATLVLAGTGVAGLLSFTVTQRTREFGVRLALGATSAGVVRLVLRQAAIQLILGFALGLAPAWAAARLLMGRLSLAVSPYDPFVDITAVLFIAAAGLLAVWLPARRAAQIDPMAALRHE